MLCPRCLPWAFWRSEDFGVMRLGGQMEIVSPNKVTTEMLLEYANECWKSGLKRYEDAVDDPKQYLYSLNEQAKGNSEFLTGDLPPTATFYGISDQKIVGAIRVRTGTNERVVNVIGHIGYETRPSARKKGVATGMLSWTINNCLEKSVYITAEKDNIASVKVIKSIGAKPLASYFDENLGEILRFEIERVGKLGTALIRPKY